MAEENQQQTSHSKESLWHTMHPLIKDAIDPHTITKLTPSQLPAYVNNVIDKVAKKLTLKLDEASRKYIHQQILHEIEGFGPIQPLMEDPHITDILINNPKEVYVERNGKLERTNITFRDKNHLMHLLLRTLSISGRNVDTTRPYVDAILPDGSRINAVLEPLVLTGPVVSIRKFGHERFSLKQLVKTGFLTEKAADYLSLATRAKLNILISGGAGSGKTTLLNALLFEIKSDDRIVVIEDTAELELAHKHFIRLLTRAPNIEGKGEITQRDLLRNSLRMRPDRIVVGEIRGNEVMDMFQAMNTGYDGSLSSVHASYTREVPIRLVNLAAMTGLEVSTDFILHQIASCIHVLVHLGRFYDGSRRLMEIDEIRGVSERRIELSNIYRHQFDPQTNEFITSFKKDHIKTLSVERAGQYGLAEELRKELLS